MSSEQTAAVKQLLLNDESEFMEHYNMLKDNGDVYKVQLLLLLELVDIQKVTKTRALLAAAQCQDYEFVDVMLSHPQFKFPEVLAACKALDGKRRLKAWKKSLALVEAKGATRADQKRPAESDGDAEVKKPKSDDASIEEMNSKIAERMKQREEREERSEDGPSITTPFGKGYSGGKGKGKGKGGKGARWAPTRSSRGRALSSVRQGIKGGKKGGKKSSSEPVDNTPVWLRRRIAKIAKLKSEIGSLEAATVVGLTATLSGSMCKRFRAWGEKIKKGSLMHYLLEFGLSPWQEFADLVHLNPDDFTLKEFLPCVFDSKKQRPAHVEYGLKLTTSTLENLDGLKAHHVPLTYLRRKFDLSRVSQQVKKTIAEYTDVSTLIWWYEDMNCPDVDNVLINKMSKGQTPNFGYGKMMERLMHMHSKNSSVFEHLVPVAENSLKEYTLPLRSPIAVLGDCSGSMHVAVRTGSIIVSLLTALSKGAELLFFNSKAVDPLFVPQSIKDVLMLSHYTKADGATSPGSALERLYLAKKRVETIIVVSDEEENDPGVTTKLTFAQLAKKYVEEVNSEVQFVLISFLRHKPEDSCSLTVDQQLKGAMYLDLKNEGITPLQLRIDGARPDLTKVDLLLGRLATESSSYCIASKLLILASSWCPLLVTQDICSHFKDLGTEFVANALSTIAAMMADSDACLKYPNLKAEHFDQLFDILKQSVDYNLITNCDLDKAVGVLKAVRSGVKDAGAELVRMAEAWNPVFDNIATLERADTDEGAVVVKSISDVVNAEPTIFKSILSFLPDRELSVCCCVSRGALYHSIEAKFNSIGARNTKTDYPDSLQQLDNFGFIANFGLEKCIDALKRNRGHVERAIGSLYGEEDGF
eukprot:TRINITY_DN1370_c2_g2_i3.p1 TRINITY_DN1370_c2_g2~~TRINITY_DN1370_c2_g2_i3.p1  ORF type:complete len:886 (+),score=214.94 TRINITY_DN1370_c2_g2_i3:48-2660(+)